MNRKLLTLSLVIIVLFQLTIISCSNDENEPEKPVVVVPEEPKPEVPVIPEVPVSTIPKPELMKPSIRNISASANKKGKRAAEQKRLIRSIKYAQNIGTNIYTYHFNTDLVSDYRALPSENLYDPGEKELNVDTERDNVVVYKYNALGQLTNIEAETVYTNNGHTNPPEEFSFEYNADGTLKKAVGSFDFGSSYSYNDKGLIDKRIEADGSVSYTYEYDDLDRIVDSYFYVNTVSNGRIPQMHYKYLYPDETSYIKTLYEINEDKTETNRNYVIYTYDPSKAGVYNKEPYYQINNQYLHVVKMESHILYNGVWQLQFESVPKYFYDADGYLIKYDSAGFNYTTDITVFEYE